MYNIKYSAKKKNKRFAKIFEVDFLYQKYNIIN